MYLTPPVQTPLRRNERNQSDTHENSPVCRNWLPEEGLTARVLVYIDREIPGEK